MMNFTNQDGNCGGVSSELMADCTRASHTLGTRWSISGYFRQRYRKLIRWVIFLFHLTRKSQYKMRPLIGIDFFLINGCRYHSILSHHGHILTLIHGSNKSSVEDLERTPWNTKHMARPSEHKASLCKSSPLWGNRGSPGCSTE